jgi:ferredoxin--NADP+ reductase
MLCGNPQMIEDMIALLAARGLRKHRVRNPGHITVEKYW